MSGTAGWERVAPWLIGWIFFDRLLGVFALPSMDASAIVQAVVIGAPGLVWAVGGWPAGALADRLGRAHAAVMALLAAAAFSLGAALAPSDGFFAATRVLSAAAQVTALAATAATLGSSPRGMGRAVGVSFMTTRFASGSVAPAVVAASSTLGSWRWAFVADAVLIAVLALAVWPLREPVRPVRPGTGLIVSKGAIVGGLLSVAALGVGITVPGLVVVEGSVLSSRMVQFSFGVAASAATLAAGILADRLGVWRVGASCLVLGVAGAVLAALGAPLVGLVGLAAAAGAVPLGLVALPLADAPAGREGSATALPRFMAEMLGGGLLTVVIVRVAVEHGAAAGFVGLAAGAAAFTALAAVAHHGVAERAPEPTRDM